MSFHQQVFAEFNGLVLEKVNERINLLKLGHSINDLSEYRRIVGEIKGLELSLELLSEAKELVEKRT